MVADDERAIIDLLGKRFISHGVRYAEQDAKGYHPVEGPLTRNMLAQHLHGTRSLGHYLISPDDDCVKLVGFDLDLRKELHVTEIEAGVKPVMIDDHICESPRSVLANPEHPDYDIVVLQLRMLAYQLSHRLARVAAELELPTTVAASFSGSKGVHVYGWFHQRMPAKFAIEIGKTTLKSFQGDGLVFAPTRGTSTFRNDLGFSAVDVEIYPKQETLGHKTHGNLMRLPLGKNLKTKGDSFFLKPLMFDGDEYRFVPTDTRQALESGTL